MSADLESEERFKRLSDLLYSENKQADVAVINNDMYVMENIFKTGGIGQEAIDLLIFSVKSTRRYYYYSFTTVGIY
jgi:hypothetical protein